MIAENGNATRLTDEQIIEGIDVRSVTVGWGLRITGQTPNEDGWLECRAVDREDRNPSAAINIHTGHYRDHGGDGASLSFFELGRMLGVASDWKGVRDELAESLGAIPARRSRNSMNRNGFARPANGTPRTNGTSKSKPKTKKVDLTSLASLGEPLTEKNVGKLLAVKAPVTLDAIEDAGGRLAVWKGFRVVVLEAVDSHGKAKGYLLLRADGKLFPELGRLNERKVHTLGGSSDGWIVPGGLEQLKQAKTVVRVEGWGDALAAYPKLPDETVVLSNLLGCGSTRADFSVFEGKDVIALGDADTPGQKGLAKFCEAVAEHASSVKVATLPYSVEAKHGKDVRDFLNEGGDFCQMLDEAKTFEAPEVEAEGDSRETTPATPLEPIWSITDPDHIADPILDATPGYAMFQEHHAEWDGAAYRFVTDREWSAKVRPLIKAEVEAETNRRNEIKILQAEAAGDVLKPKDYVRLPAVNRSVVANVVSAMESNRLIASTREPPFWISGNQGKPDPKNIIATPSGLFDVANPDGNLICRTPDFFTLTSVKYDVDRKAKCPLWEQTLWDIFQDDPDQIESFQEWLGYLMTGDTSFEVIALLQGETRAGKSTLVDTIEDLIGKQAFASIQSSEFASPFGMQSIVSKSVVVLADMRVAPSDRPTFLGRLLSISGNDSLTVNRKHKPQIDVRLPCRLMMVTNETPDLGDSTDALCQRILPFRFTRRFTSENGRDNTRKQRLKQELPGILNWAIEGLQRLRQRGQFTKSESGERLIETVGQTNAPIRSFVDERCDVGAGHQIEKLKLYAAYRQWCVDSSTSPPTANQFARELMSAYPLISPSRPRDKNRGRLQCFANVKLRPEHGTQNDLAGESWV